MATERDYDSDPDRFRLGARITAAHLHGTTLYEKIAGLLADHGVTRVLDLGCGEGALGAAIRDGFDDPPAVVGMDASATMLAAVPAPVVRADAGGLPFHDNAFDAVVTVNVLDHLPDPLPTVRATHRVLRPGGVLVAGAVSRHDSPELADVWRPKPTPFDAEDAPDVVASVFGPVTVDGWDAPLVTLPDTGAITDYLRARFVPAERAAADARVLGAPLTVTKRGALVIGTKA